MEFKTLIKTGWRKLSRLTADIKANAAMIFALVALPMFMIAGFAIDHNRHITEQKKLQVALDVTALAAAREFLDSKPDEATLKVFAQNFFDGQFMFQKAVAIEPLDVTLNDSEVVVTTTGTLDTTMMSVIGRKNLPLGTEAAVVFGVTKPVEIALVLDTSGSMSGSKMTTLKSAAKSMVEVLLPSLTPADNESVKVSVVPFARYVNVGTDKRNESWIDVDPNKDVDRESCWISSKAYKKAGCKKKSYKCTKWKGSVEAGNRTSYQGTCKKWECPKGAKPKQTCKKKVTKYRWYGCVASRPSPLNVQDKNYGSDPIWGFTTTNGNLCPSAIQELTNSQSKVTGAIDALNAKNDTYIATGLMWGLRTLSSIAPFDEGEDEATFKAKEGRKALVLMSDGANTRSPNKAGLHNWSSVTTANNNTTAVCDELRAQEVEVFTIAFEITDAATKTMLENCATSTENYYDASNAAELQTAFDDIGADLRELSLAR